MFVMDQIFLCRYIEMSQVTCMEGSPANIHASFFFKFSCFPNCVTIILNKQILYHKFKRV